MQILKYHCHYSCVSLNLTETWHDRSIVTEDYISPELYILCTQGEQVYFTPFKKFATFHPIDWFFLSNILQLHLLLTVDGSPL